MLLRRARKLNKEESKDSFFVKHLVNQSNGGIMPTKFARNPASRERRKRVITRLEAQLLTGFKAVKNEETSEISTVKLTEEDRKRIETEIETLKTRT